MKSFILKIWNIVKVFLTWLWNKVKSWFLKTAWPWIKKSWLQIVNVLIVMYAYSKLDGLAPGPATLVGLWAFILLVYWVFWKFFGGDKIVKSSFKKKEK